MTILPLRARDTDKSNDICGLTEEAAERLCDALDKAGFEFLRWNSRTVQEGDR